MVLGLLNTTEALVVPEAPVMVAVAAVEQGGRTQQTGPGKMAVRQTVLRVLAEAGQAEVLLQQV